jgi:DNA polymerase III delta prime subunit
MQGAIIIYGGNKTERDQTVQDLLGKKEIQIGNNPDVLVIDAIEGKRSIGISQSKLITKYINEKPFSHKYKVVIVNNANKLTIEAQNALLKTLEEPPAYATIILECSAKNNVLETILSRCKRIPLGQKESHNHEDANEFETLKDILKMKLGERLTIAADLGKVERDELIEILESWIREGSSLLKHNSTYKLGAILENIIAVNQDLTTTNINQKVAIEYLLLSI